MRWGGGGIFVGLKAVLPREKFYFDCRAVRAGERRSGYVCLLSEEVVLAAVETQHALEISYPTSLYNSTTIRRRPPFSLFSSQDYVPIAIPPCLSPPPGPRSEPRAHYPAQAAARRQRPRRLRVRPRPQEDPQGGGGRRHGGPPCGGGGGGRRRQAAEERRPQRPRGAVAGGIDRTGVAADAAVAAGDGAAAGREGRVAHALRGGCGEAGGLVHRGHAAGGDRGGGFVEEEGRVWICCSRRIPQR